MAETKRPKGLAPRRGYALLLTAGDAEISGALADGIMAVRGTGDLIRPPSAATFPIGGRLGEAKPLTQEEARVVTSAMKWLSLQAQGVAQDAGETRGQGSEASCAGRGASSEIDRQKVAELLRVAMHREPVDYAGKVFDAEMEYGESLFLPGPMRKVGEFLLVRYALVVLAFEKLFKAVSV